MANINDLIDSASGNLQELTNEADNANKSLNKMDDTVQDLNLEYGKMASSASAALGGLAAGLSKTNPLLSQAAGSLQKMIPMIIDLAAAARKGATAFKAMFASTGIGLLIVALEELVMMIDKIKEKAGAAKSAMDSLTESYKSLDDINKKYQDDRLSADAKYAKQWAEYNQAIIDGEAELQRLRNKGFDSSNKRYSELSEQVQKNKEALAQFEKDRAEQVAINNAKIVESNKKVTSSTTKETDSLSKVYSELDSIADSILNTTAPAVESVLDSLGDDNLKTIGEWLSRDFSELEKSIAAINLKRDEFIQAGVDEVEATKWAEEEKKKLRDEAALDEKQKASELQKMRMDNIITFVDAMSTSYKTISSAIESQLDAELEAGTISESLYKKRKKTLQAFNIAAIVSDCASGITKLWTAYAAEKISNATLVNPIAVAAANAKSLASAIAQTAALSATAAAGIASVNSGTLNGSSATTASASISTAPVAQTYVMNNDYSDVLNSIDKKIGESQPVLVLDDLNRVQDNYNRVKAISSF